MTQLRDQEARAHSVCRRAHPCARAFKCARTRVRARQSARTRPNSAERGHLQQHQQVKWREAPLTHGTAQFLVPHSTAVLLILHASACARRKEKGAIRNAMGSTAVLCGTARY